MSLPSPALLLMLTTETGAPWRSCQLESWYACLPASLSNCAPARAPRLALGLLLRHEVAEAKGHDAQTCCVQQRHLGPEEEHQSGDRHGPADAAQQGEHGDGDLPQELADGLVVEKKSTTAKQNQQRRPTLHGKGEFELLRLPAAHHLYQRSRRGEERTHLRRPVPIVGWVEPVWQLVAVPHDVVRKGEVDVHEDRGSNASRARGTVSVGGQHHAHNYDGQSTLDVRWCPTLPHAGGHEHLWDGRRRLDGLDEAGIHDRAGDVRASESQPARQAARGDEAPLATRDGLDHAGTACVGEPRLGAPSGGDALQEGERPGEAGQPQQHALGGGDKRNAHGVVDQNPLHYPTCMPQLECRLLDCPHRLPAGGSSTGCAGCAGEATRWARQEPSFHPAPWSPPI
mmetsp:Transcript_78924/g.243561  ORF Transcript_78924/g.243561 Transcript_78924/m.243561 type:complete len:399 (-) Transcript_78924:13-1209(-)